MSSLIRPAQSSDQAAIEEIVRLAYSPYITRMDQIPGPMRDDYGVRIAGGGMHVLVLDEVVCGMIILKAEDQYLALGNVALHPKVQGRGYGRQLMEFAEAAALQAGCQAIRLYTNVAMVENIALYSRLGYVETHRAQVDGYRRVFMEKRLG